jgi:uncharacterized membrane-anchored protein YhcB (DUF1043 family)
MSILAGKATWLVVLVALSLGIVVGLAFGSATEDADAAKRRACPTGTLFHEGVCVEKALRATNASFSSAQTDCLDETETRLPTSAELQTLDDVRRDFSEWSNHAYTDSGNNLAISVNNDASNDTTSVVTQTSSIGYRCVKQKR